MANSVIKAKFIKYATKTQYNTDNSAGYVPANATVYIQDSGELITHGITISGMSVTNTASSYITASIAGNSYKLSLDGHTHSYLPLSGGTLTGALVTNPNVLGWIFRNSPSWYGSISYDSYGGECLGIMFENSSTKFKVKAGYDSSSFAGNNAYTSMTNADLEVGAGYAKINGNTVWHAGNDGSGSGLDADMLYGLHADCFLYGSYKGFFDSVGGACSDYTERTGFYTSSGFTDRPSGVLNWGTLQTMRLYSNHTLYTRQVFSDCYSSIQ